MLSPLATAVRGKGILPFLSRSYAIAARYGFSAGKMAQALSQLVGVLMEYDCRATIPVTACALARQPSLAEKYQALGLELAVHGYKHVDYLQLSAEQHRDHLCRARQVFEQAGIPAVGFRSPYLRWNGDMLSLLEEYGFDYDSSQVIAWNAASKLETEAYTRVLQFYGARSADQYPSLPRLVGNLVQIPYCLPDDEALVERMGLLDRSEMSQVWVTMLDLIYSAGELFTLGIHPERASLCKEALHAVLAKARSLSPAVWIARLSEIAAWYRCLAEVTFATMPQANGCTRVTINAPAGAVVLARNIITTAPGQRWGWGYERIPGNVLDIEGYRHPWIGLPPDSPASLKSFLQHQGYLVETSTDPDAFSFYVERRTFQPEDERSLLSEIETGTQPLLRIGRWPEGARAALAVTGDIDAFTLWDYGLRFFNY